MKASGEWAQRSACLGADPDKFFAEKGHTYAEGRAICATCPVAAQCLDSAIERREHDGLWGGMPERERRRLRVAWLQKVPGHQHRPGHGCAWCVAVDAHLDRLRSDTKERVNLNGPNARHGKASTYARGCSCGACTLAYAAPGRRLRDAGWDVLSWWRQWFGDSLDRGEENARYQKARLLAEVDATEAAA